MPGPLYETEEHLAAEGAFARRIEAAFPGLRLEKAEPLSPIDFRVFRGERLVGWAELKCRAIRSETYPSLMVSLSKLAAGSAARERDRVPYVLFVAFVDRDLFYIAGGEELVRVEFGFGGRTVRTREGDRVEPVAYIPLGLFRPLPR